jgi:hypothetical protein
VLFSFTIMIYPTKLNMDEKSFWIKTPTIHYHGIISLTKWFNKKTSTKKLSWFIVVITIIKPKVFVKRPKLKTLKNLKNLPQKNHQLHQSSCNLKQVMLRNKLKKFQIVKAWKFETTISRNVKNITSLWSKAHVE